MSKKKMLEELDRRIAYVNGQLAIFQVDCSRRRCLDARLQELMSLRKFVEDS